MQKMKRKIKNILIIAEIGVNHNQNINLAKKMIKSAKSSGADAVKFQIYKTEEIILKNAKTAPYQKRNTKVSNQFQLLKKLELSTKNFDTLFEYAKKIKIKASASIFDLSSAKYLIKKKPDFIKIPSGEITNFKLLNFIARFKKKIILSTGASSLIEIQNAISILLKKGVRKKNITILHCVSNYPTSINNINIGSISYFKRYFDLDIGLSDHTKSTLVPSYSVYSGARVIEKHFTLKKTLSGPDHKSSLNPREFKEMVKSVRNSELIYGYEKKIIGLSESKNKFFIRKSLVANKRIKKGQKFTKYNITAKRPGDGICASKYFYFLGKIAKKNYEKNEKL